MTYVVIHSGGAYRGSDPRNVAEKAIENHPNVEKHRDDGRENTSNVKILKNKITEHLVNGTKGYIEDFLNVHGSKTDGPLYIAVASFRD